MRLSAITALLVALTEARGGKGRRGIGTEAIVEFQPSLATGDDAGGEVFAGIEGFVTIT